MTTTTLPVPAHLVRRPTMRSAAAFLSVVAVAGGAFFGGRASVGSPSRPPAIVSTVAATAPGLGGNLARLCRIDGPC